MTLAGAAPPSKAPLPHMFLVELRKPSDQAAIARLEQQFPAPCYPQSRRRRCGIYGE